MLLKKKISKKLEEIISSILIILIIFFVGLNGALFFFRLDITENQIFSISNLSKELFKEISDQVYITYFVSDKLRSRTPLPTQVEDMLNEYAAYSRGKIVVDIIDPVKENMLQQVQSFGLYADTLPVGELDEVSFVTVYSGIVIQYMDKYKIIPFVDRADDLEIKLTANIRNLVAEEEKTVGILLGKNDFDMEYYSHLRYMLERYYNVEEVARGTDIPSRISVLLVLGGRDLEDFDIFPIDQFIMQGGAVLFCVEAVEINMDILYGFPIQDLPLVNMLAAYGIAVKSELVMENIPIKIPVQGKPPRQFEYPFWVPVKQENVSKNNPITSNFGGLIFFWVSPVVLIPMEGIEAEVIINSTAEASVAQEIFPIHPDQAMKTYYNTLNTMGTYGLVAALSGSFNSFFIGKDIPAREGVEREWSKLIETGKDTRLLVIGDADFCSQFYTQTGSIFNLEFATACVMWLFHDEDLLQIKTRDTREVALNKIKDPEEKASAITGVQILNLFIVPFLVVCFGLWRYIARNQKKKRSISKRGGSL